MPIYETQTAFLAPCVFENAVLRQNQAEPVRMRRVYYKKMNGVSQFSDNAVLVQRAPLD